ncbi:MAG TPA: hypothetical protein VEF06_02515 [Bryobacteraceae bacterium]|nr:hypothetical protein [Bryobacteraceae bacterium]
MKTESSVAGVDLIGLEDPGFEAALETLLGRRPDEVLIPALPYSVIARNFSARAIALLGVRFDMTSAAGKSCSVVHYADSLRNPENADLAPGRMRFVSAEPLYTRLVLRREDRVDPRGPMNLANLRKAIGIRASVDCVAFDDGSFTGPDSLHAFDRLARERAGELEFLAALPAPPASEDFLLRATENPGLRALARKLYEGLTTGGEAEMKKRAAGHRCRLPLHR